MKFGCPNDENRRPAMACQFLQGTQWTDVGAIVRALAEEGIDEGDDEQDGGNGEGQWL